MLNSIIQLLNDEEEKVLFVDTYLSELNKYPFGSMNKTDIEALLIFSLYKASKINFLFDFSNDEIASMLRVNHSKVNSIRANVFQKYFSQNQDSIIKILFQQLSASKIKVEYDVNLHEVSFVIENNLIKQRLEVYAKKFGGYINYKRNREVVIIKTELLYDIIEEVFPGEMSLIYSKIIQIIEMQVIDAKNISSEEARKQLIQKMSLEMIPVLFTVLAKLG
jgi:hypothetical protein